MQLHAQTTHLKYDIPYLGMIYMLPMLTYDS